MLPAKQCVKSRHCMKEVVNLRKKQTNKKKLQDKGSMSSYESHTRSI